MAFALSPWPRASSSTLPCKVAARSIQKRRTSPAVGLHCSPERYFSGLSVAHGLQAAAPSSTAGLIAVQVWVLGRQNRQLFPGPFSRGLRRAPMPGGDRRHRRALVRQQTAQDRERVFCLQGDDGVPQGAVTLEVFVQFRGKAINLRQRPGKFVWYEQHAGSMPRKRSKRL